MNVAGECDILHTWLDSNGALKLIIDGNFAWIYDDVERGTWKLRDLNDIRDCFFDENRLKSKVHFKKCQIKLSSPPSKNPFIKTQKQ
jgi:hypothetical protein